MKNTIIKLAVIFSSLLCSPACQNQAATSQNSDELSFRTAPKTLDTAAQPSQTKDEKAISVEDIVAERDSLKFEGYEIKKFLTKKKYDNDSPIAEINDAVLQKNGETLLKFEGVYYPLGNQIEFGSFSFLNNKAKQLIIYENTLRFGRVWIVSLSPKPKILFDSGDWGAFREFVDTKDIDEDGSYEISMGKEEDLGFEKLAHIEIPLIGFDFKYDNRLKKFLPANHKFQKSSEIINALFGGKKTKDFIGTFLTYVYAGEENKAWEFFDKEYTLEDKESRKAKIKNVLSNDPIYQFIKNEVSKH